MSQIEYRYERKYPLNDTISDQAKSLLIGHPLFFRTIYYPRIISSVYFDTYRFDSVSDNLAGISKREKVRVRWYNHLTGKHEQSALEFKRKRGSQIHKTVIGMGGFEIPANMDLSDLIKTLRTAELPAQDSLFVSSLSPALVTSYRREYLLSSNGQLRVTLDTELEFYRVINSCASMKYQITDPKCIMELKYSPEASDSARLFAEHFPVRISRFSKYTDGMLQYF